MVLLEKRLQNGYVYSNVTGVFDDRDRLVITFTDGTSVTIVAYYGSFTGASKDEFPFISIGDVVEDKN